MIGGMDKLQVRLATNPWPLMGCAGSVWRVTHRAGDGQIVSSGSLGGPRCPGPQARSAHGQTSYLTSSRIITAFDREFHHKNVRLRVRHTSAAMDSRAIGNSDRPSRSKSTRH